MAVPVTYNLRSLRRRWVSALVAVLGIAGTVGVFVAMLALANGFRATLVSSGSAENAIVRRSGATGEMESVITLDSVRIIEDAPGIARAGGRPLASAEVVVIATFPLKEGGTPANAQVRGVSPNILDVRKTVQVVEGRFFEAGRNELVIGRNVASSYAGFELGNKVEFGGGTWTVVGVFDAGGSAFDSEVWCDAHVLNQVYLRPPNIYQSVTARLESAGEFQRFKDALTSDPRLTVQVDREVEYYNKQSRQLTTLITVLGSIVALVMGVGAVFGALNTMYSAVVERTREIGTMRALGFTPGSVVASFLVESLSIALLGGVLGCIAVLPLNDLTTGAMNWSTFSYLAFAFQITPPLLGAGLVFAVLMGVVGGVPPALRAARLPIVAALREL
jgi:putative ABC transport system permease protein